MAEAPSLIPASPAAPAPVAPAPDALPPGRPEPARTEPAAKKFEIEADKIPEKYRTAEDPLGEFLKGFDNLNGLVGKKDEELRAAVEAELKGKLFEGRPEAADKYELPKGIEGVDEKAMADSDLVKWWRETAFSKGLDQKGFEEGVSKYIEAARANVPVFEDEVKKLGDNASQRLEALGLWANTLPADAKNAALGIATTAKGVEMLETLMKGLKPGAVGEEPPNLDTGDTKETIDKLMASKAYHSPAHRDPKVVARVEAFFKKQYGGAA